MKSYISYLAQIMLWFTEVVFSRSSLSIQVLSCSHQRFEEQNLQLSCLLLSNCEDQVSRFTSYVAGRNHIPKLIRSFVEERRKIAAQL